MKQQIQGQQEHLEIQVLLDQRVKPVQEETLGTQETLEQLEKLEQQEQQEQLEIQERLVLKEILDQLDLQE